MAYNRAPNVVLAGTGLKQNPLPTPVTPPGIVSVTLDANIASTTDLGVVQIGSGLNITPLGVLSTVSGSGLISVKLTGANYTGLSDDYYIGATANNITVTLPLGVTGKVYIVKNQVAGNITVTGTGGQKLDTSNNKSLGTNDSIVVVFDGTRWNIIES